MIKKYLEFIKENKDKNTSIRILNKPKNISKSFLEDFLLDFIDNDWYYEISEEIISKHAFNEEPSMVNYPISVDKEEYVFIYSIYLSSTEKTFYERGLENRFNFLSNYIKRKPECDVKIPYENELYDINNIGINQDNKFFIKSIEEDLGVDLEIWIKDNDLGEISTKEMFNYYDFEYDYEKDGQVFIEVEYDKLINGIDEDYGDILKNGFPDVEMPYDDLSEDLHRLLEMLSKENFDLLIDIEIKEYGGWGKYSNEELEQLNIDEEIKSINDLKDFLYNERFYRTSDEFFDNGNDDLVEITNIYNNIHNVKLINVNYEMVETAFTDAVWESIKGEEITKTEKNKEGVEVNKKYFSIPFSNEWLDGFEEDDLRRFSIDEILDDYISNIIPFEMKSIEYYEYVYVDNVKFNTEVNKYLKKQL